MNQIANKTILLTGASGGIGGFIASSLATEQATVICVARSLEKLEQLCRQIKSQGGNGIAIPFDISNIEKLPDLVQQIHQEIGSVDILINNAAIEKYKYFPDYSQTEIQSILTTNLLAAMELTRLIMPNMLETNSGHIVNIASGSGKKGIAYNSVYSASKAGLIIWNDAIRQELSDTNVNVSLICPGYTNAGMYVRNDVKAPKVAHVAEPTEVAQAVIAAIKQNKAEIMLDGAVSRILFAITQISPELGDAIYRSIGLNKLYKNASSPPS
ncbi:SDR family NAD(P)-dependent oxidoreductase [Rivularia sp. UHCC 0363]|uniref:SDR family NAD(P)-dependent oxidoreductase n=1 Tax=Rivularia sp. UHCC 0363 TaxID=3110244 RepID=UPI002B20AC9C|nr:SDR family NAD(P)-dependent oxidoreductase [Rivularia sp. UHCC 0363]MEA5597024.1 SDR family NAD(P)-dependent oxidoreductase [Rivularia sp. UHCC 0363]